MKFTDWIYAWIVANTKKFRKKEALEPEKYLLLYHPNPAVTAKCEDFDIESPSEKEYALEIAGELKKILMKCNGVSFSANQIGVLKRVCVYRVDPRQVEPFVCFNPVIVKLGRNMKTGPEGSFSVPLAGQIQGPVVMVQRHATIEVEYFDQKFQKVHRKLNGWDARIFQHEIDQLDGVFIRRMIDQKTEIQTAKIS